MKRREFLKHASTGAAGLAFGASHWTSALAQETATKKVAALDESLLTTPGSPIPIVTLKGTARERGRIHGEILKPHILRLCEQWRESLGRPEGMSPEEYIERFVADTGFEDAIARFTPDLLEEVEGIAEATGLPYNTVFAMQLVDEEWWYSMNRDLVKDESADKCTAIGVSKSDAGPSIVAQNMDIPAYAHGAMVLFHVKPKDSDLEALVLSYAGLICLNGMNNRGIAVCVNALLPLADAKDGLPVAFVNRGILERRTLEEAERFVLEIRHASGQAYNIGSPQKVVCYECSAGKSVAFVPSPGATRFVHTNHPIVNDELSPLGRAVRDGTIKATGPKDSEARYQAADQRIRDPAGPVSIETIRAALCSHDSEEHPVCRHGATAACTIYELTDPPRAHCCKGPPCSGTFAVAGF